MGGTNRALGMFIRQSRKLKNMTLRMLEEKSGISYSQLSKIERGESVPLKSNLDKIVEALDSNKDEVYHLAGYLPSTEYIMGLDGGYQLPIPELSQDFIHEDVFRKLKLHREKEGKETSHVSFDRDGTVSVYVTNKKGKFISEIVEKYMVHEVLIFDNFESQFETVRVIPEDEYQLNIFSEWLEAYFKNFSPDEQEILFEELKDYAQYKGQQVIKNRMDNKN